MSVGRRFLTTMGIPILIGRDIGERDTAKSPSVAVVNGNFREKVFCRPKSVGKDLLLRQARRKPRGVRRKTRRARRKTRPKRYVRSGGRVCKDAKYDNLKYEIPPTAYLAYLQNLEWMRGTTFEIRTALPPLALAGTVRRAVAETL